jgi:hypothetical protein
MQSKAIFVASASISFLLVTAASAQRPITRHASHNQASIEHQPQSGLRHHGGVYNRVGHEPHRGQPRGMYIPSGYDNCRKKLGDSMVAVIICSVRG